MIKGDPNTFDCNAETFNLVESISKSKKLYLRLICITHPDKNPDNLDIALELTNTLNEFRYNYNELLLLEERINKELLMA